MRWGRRWRGEAHFTLRSSICCVPSAPSVPPRVLKHGLFYFPRGKEKTKTKTEMRLVFGVMAHPPNFLVCAGMEVGAQTTPCTFHSGTLREHCRSAAGEPLPSPTPAHLVPHPSRARGRLLLGGPRPPGSSSPASPSLGLLRPRLCRALARAPRPWVAPTIQGKSLASGSKKEPHPGHPGPPRLRVRAAPARRGPQIPAQALPRARPRPRRRASLLPAVRETLVRWTPPRPGQEGALRPRGTPILTPGRCSPAAVLCRVPFAGVRAGDHTAGPAWVRPFGGFPAGPRLCF